MAELELVGIGMRLGFDNFCHNEIAELFRRVGKLLDLKTDDGQLVENFFKGRTRVEMILEPA